MTLCLKRKKGYAPSVEKRKYLIIADLRLTTITQRVKFVHFFVGGVIRDLAMHTKMCTSCFQWLAIWIHGRAKLSKKVSRQVLKKMNLYKGV